MKKQETNNIKANLRTLGWILTTVILMLFFWIATLPSALHFDECSFLLGMFAIVPFWIVTVIAVIDNLE